jgi:hypothetical protein
VHVGQLLVLQDLIEVARRKAAQDVAACATVATDVKAAAGVSTSKSGRQGAVSLTGGSMDDPPLVSRRSRAAGD